MSHIFDVRPTSAKRVLRPTAELLQGGQVLSLFLDDRALVAKLEGLFGEKVTGFTDPELHGWLERGMSAATKAVQEAVMEACGYDENVRWQMSQSPTQLELPRDVERSFAYWMLHNLSSEPAMEAVLLEFDVDAFGDNGVDMFDYYLVSGAWRLSSWMVRLAVEFAAAGGHDAEQNPIRWHFEDGGGQWPELGPCEDSAAGIAWAARGFRQSPRNARLRFLIHPDWLPAQTTEPFQSWA